MYHITKVLIVFDRVCLNPCALILMSKQQFQPEEVIYPLCFQNICVRSYKQSAGGPALCCCWEHSWEKRFLESLDSLTLGSEELALKPSSFNSFKMTYLLTWLFTATFFYLLSFLIEPCGEGVSGWKGHYWIHPSALRCTGWLLAGKCPYYRGQVFLKFHFISQKATHYLHIRALATNNLMT